MRARNRIPQRFIAVAAIAALMILGGKADSARASHDGRFLVTNYFVNAFIEDIPNTPLALVRVADCETQAHYHASIITSAVARWNATNRVRFVYDTNQPTVVCDGAGFPTVGNVVSVIHDSSVPTGDYNWNQQFDSFRNNDWGPESSAGMYPMTTGRVRLGDNYDTVEGVTHELAGC